MGKLVEPKLNKDGVIIYPNLHDSYLTKVELLPEKKAIILIDTQKTKYEFYFNDVKYLRCSPFRQGNIIFDVNVWCGTEYSPDELREALEMKSEKSKLYIENTSKAISEGRLTLFQVNPSYGCELICLCGSYSISEL